MCSSVSSLKLPLRIIKTRQVVVLKHYSTKGKKPVCDLCQRDLSTMNRTGN